ncbi:MAG: MarC family protein [Opitutaceae bacterium]|nr:MarC family protein [Opitutaceae bacterium]
MRGVSNPETPAISRLLGRRGLQIVSRLTGLFVCASDARIIFPGIKGYF